MRLHTVFITYNRLELSKQAIESYLATVPKGTYSYLIVDNGSEDDTIAWCHEQKHPVLCLGENRYPGYACNQGWAGAPSDTSHFQRADNDFIFLRGWYDEARRKFDGSPQLGQLGLRTDDEELHSTVNVGGNCIIRRGVWDEGLRWDERPWPLIRDEVGPGWTEDSLFSSLLAKKGWKWQRVEKPCIQPISHESPDDEYYRQTWADRGIQL